MLVAKLTAKYRLQAYLLGATVIHYMDKALSVL